MFLLIIKFIQKAVNLGVYANLFAQVSDTGPSWSFCFRMLSTAILNYA